MRQLSLVAMIGPCYKKASMNMPVYSLNWLPYDALLLILCRCDNRTLCKLSSVPTVWGQVSSIVTSQQFWFARVQLLSPLCLTFDQTCWRTTWHVVNLATTSIETTFGPLSGLYSLSCTTLNAVKVLSSLNLPLNEANNRLLTLACNSNDVDTVAYLIQRTEVLQTEALQTTDCLTYAVREGSYDVVAHLLANLQQRDNVALDVAMRLDYVHIVRLLLRERPELRDWTRHWRDYLLSEARRNNRELLAHFLEKELD